MRGTMVDSSSLRMKSYADLAHLNIIAEMAQLSRQYRTGPLRERKEGWFTDY